MLFDDDIKCDPLVGKSIAIVGYGNQGRAQALNLRDSGSEVIVAARSNGGSYKKAKADGFVPQSLAQAAANCDVCVLLTPDETHGQIYTEILQSALQKDLSLVVGHGFSLHFKHWVPRTDLDVCLVAPIGPGTTLRENFKDGHGIPATVAVFQNASGRAMETTLAYAKRIGCGRAGIVKTTLSQECETDLFGEQAVICGGISALVQAGFEILVEAGYQEELAYFECSHQLKLLADLIHEHGIAGMRARISNTAAYGDLKNGRRVVSEHSKQQMREILAEIQSGEFAKDFADNLEQLGALKENAAEHPIEKIGEKIRRNIFGSAAATRGRK